MRIITGSARGRRLETLNGLDVRPTTEKVKEAIFSSIQFDIEGRRVLDLFAGSGQLGIEALSRGAQSAVFVDSSVSSLECVKRNLATAGFTATTVKSDSMAFLKTTDKVFDIAFLDPPYNAGVLEQTLEYVTQVMSNHGIIVCEFPTDLVLPDEVNGFTLVKNSRYGKICTSIYRKQ